MERIVGSYERSLPLPPNHDADKIDALLENGILSVKIPKKESHSGEEKSIKINKKEPL